ncbi:peptidase M14 [Bordetella genomosp. 1]|uniref:Peptidase M14 n=1 Tax=Bordetella genomosp. 1 TaxID=1395607 RepID=A0ABX4EV29_9BORD|nr:peptidase M14 [Bordetella genomosp. 1]OZI58007.1 peptidase M14 [Bordetella genomosp. 1]
MELLDTSFPRTLTDWLDTYATPAWRGATLEGWLFEGPEARRAAETRLARAGVTARLRSAYKPLLHFFLEEAEREGLVAVHVTYPIHPDAQQKRFTLEAYPLTALLAPATVRFAPAARSAGAVPEYALVLSYADGAQRRATVAAPQSLSQAVDGLPQRSPTGWLRVRDGAGAVRVDGPVCTEYEALFRTAMDTLTRHPWGHDEPYFERLSIRADIPGIEYALPHDEDIVSTCEGLHEDFYFSLLEFFQRHSGRPMGDRGLQPGQIAPDVRLVDGPARLRIATEAVAPATPLTPRLPAGALAERTEPLLADEIAGLVAALGGTPFSAPTRQRRAVLGTYVRGSGPAVLISGAQHANETSGVVGALRAARALVDQGDAHFALIACENPDGYAMYAQLRAVHPRHMHHASRYSAMGDDIAYREREPLLELAARREAVALSGARLHINLHGYPAHEWTRPLSGYLPRNFESWTLPKGFFLLLRHHPGLEAEAEHLIEGVTAQLARAVPGLAEFNARQIALFEAHALERGFALRHGIPVQVTATEREATPLALTTEFPDETVYGERYRFAHTVQMETVLAAVARYRAGP